MKTYVLTKGRTTFKIRIGADTAHQTKIVNGHTDTTLQEMKPVTAQRRVNELMRDGYTAK